MWEHAQPVSGGRETGGCRLCPPRCRRTYSPVETSAATPLVHVKSQGTWEPAQDTGSPRDIGDLFFLGNWPRHGAVENSCSEHNTHLDFCFNVGFRPGNGTIGHV